MNNIYAHPRYYEIAFSYRDIPREVDVMEEAMEMYSKIPVKTVLELACGNSPHLLELAKRGYEYHGLDLSSSMLEFAKEKAESSNYHAHFHQANLVDFQLGEQIDFLYVMLGSLYVGNTAELISHFQSAQDALKPGGLYFLDWCVDFSPLDHVYDSWVTKRDRITVTTRYATRLHNAAEQLYEENLTFLIKDKGRQHRLVHKGIRRAIFPQEFLLAATKLHKFEFIGWWDNWDWQAPLAEQDGKMEITRPITILRRL